MGFLDKFKKQSADLKDKAADLAASHGDKIDQGIDKAADLASKATKGKYDDKIEGAADKAKDAADKLAEGDNKA
ncbi:MAG: antitoxin [Actinomycetota bacterium]|nr:antitoxin [Actinomycetota bacterium]